MVGSSVSPLGTLGGEAWTPATPPLLGPGRRGGVRVAGCLWGTVTGPLCPHRQYYWYDERGKKVKCTAPQYVDFVMSSVQKLVTDEDVFPTKYGTSLPCCAPPCWAAVAADAKGPDLRDGGGCVPWAVRPGRCALAGVSAARVKTAPTPGSGPCALCRPTSLGT